MREISNREYAHSVEDTIRDEIIKLFEKCGMDVRPDGKEY